MLANKQLNIISVAFLSYNYECEVNKLYISITEIDFS